MTQQTPTTAMRGGRANASRRKVGGMREKLLYALGLICGAVMVWIWTTTSLGQPLWFPFVGG